MSSKPIPPPTAMPIMAVVLSNGSSSSVELPESDADPAAVDEELSSGVAVGFNDVVGDGVSPVPVPASAITGDKVGVVVLFETDGFALGTEDSDGPELG